VPLTFCRAAAASISDTTYTSKMTGNTFVLVSTKATQATAEASCLSKGGHLAAFMSNLEQDEVERHFITQVSWCCRQE
jgi:hypothetical protein